MTKRRPTMGSDPLDSLVPETDAPAKANGRKAPARRRRATSAGEPEQAPKQRATFHLPVDLMERARSAVYWTPGATMADLAEEALRRELDRREKKRGEPFPPFEGRLKGGRPVGS